MSSDSKNAEDTAQDNATSSAEENDEKEDVKEQKVEEKVNSTKPAAKKKATEPPKIKQPAKKRVKAAEQVEKESAKDKKEEKAKQEEDEDEESEDEDGGEKNTSVPLLDQPLEVSGSRKRKEVQRFVPPTPDEESKEVKVPDGKGTQFGDIETIDYNLTRAKPEELKVLYRLCFSTNVGKLPQIKKLLKQFKGLPFEEGSDEFTKKVEHVRKTFKKVTTAQLKGICYILDIEKGGTKDDILDRILSFIALPKDGGKKVVKGRSKRKGSNLKNYDEGDKSFKSRKKSKISKSKVKDSDDSEDEKDESQEEEEEEEEEAVTENNAKEEVEENGNNSESEEDEEKPKKTPKKDKKAAEADKKAPPKKRAAAKKAAEKKPSSEGESEDSEDDEPLVKKTKTPPTDEDLKAYVKSLLDGADLETITMKKVCQDVYANYPDHDLSHKKDFIKTTVKSLISS